MIFISQMGLIAGQDEAALDRWYLEHLRIMVTVPGILSAQRFKTDSPGFPPSLAMYSVTSPAVFDAPYYLSVRGMGAWLPLVDRTYYKRNLFDGLEYAPRVAEDARMLIADRARAEGAIAGIEFTWLECVGIDRSTPYRGLAVVARGKLPTVDATVAVYRPVSPRVTPAAR